MVTKMSEVSDVEVPIFFYDAECGICDRSVAFLLKHSPSENLLFAPLQSEFGKATLAERGIVDPEMRAAYFCDSSGAVAKSTAVLKGLARCRQPFSILSLLRFIPEGIRDFFYDLVARNRYRIPWLKKPVCRILTPEERARILGAS